MPKPTAPGVISPGELYRLDEVQARLGLGASALRTARRNGLKVYRFGGRGFIKGSDLIGHITTSQDGEEQQGCTATNERGS